MTAVPETPEDVSPAAEGAGAGLAARFREVRALSERLAAPLSPEDQQVQSMADCSPTKWHLGHVSWFFETFILGPHAAGYTAFHPDYNYIFNSYYEQVGPRHARPQRGMLTRPPLADVMAYRAHVDAHVSRLLENAGANERARLAPLVVLGLHHEQQHQELLLTDIKHALASQPMFPAYRDDLSEPPSTGDAGGEMSFVPFPGGTYAVGFDADSVGDTGDGFCFDNETPRHEVLLGDFALADRPVTNADFAAFIADGGYDNPALWLSDGWAWVQAGGGNMWGEKAPLYWWRDEDGDWQEFTLGGWRPLDPGAPVSHLTYFEADAYAAWANAHWPGARLPTEAEWEVAAMLSRASESGANLMATGCLHPVAARAPRRGLGRMFGDVWEWTSSAYGPYPGFRPARGAIGEYNGKFMVSQLVLKGGSCVTRPGHVRASYRNFFYPHQNWQFTGLRLARGS